MTFFFKISLHFSAKWRTAFLFLRSKKGAFFLIFLHTKTRQKLRQFLSKRADTKNPKATRKTNFSAINHNQQKMIRKIGHLHPSGKGNTKRPIVRPCLVWVLLCPFLRAFILVVFVMVSFTSFVRSFPSVAFSDSRLSGSSAAASCRAFLPLVSGVSVPVGVGCASGVDSLVRSAFPHCSVFRVASFLVGGRVARASFALRSSALVSWCASRGGLLVAFPLGACGVPASWRG